MAPTLAIDALAAAAQSIPPGLKIALAHVPSWTHAFQVLTQHLAAFGQSVANMVGSAMKAFAHGTHSAK